MEKIYSALIIGGFSLITAFVTYWLSLRLRDSDKEVLRPELRGALSGKWIGFIDQDVGFEPKPMTYSADFFLEPTAKSILGNCQVSASVAGNKLVADLKLEGGVYYGQFLRLDYINRNRVALHFGSMVLELDPDLRKMSGKFTGYGAHTKQIVNGRVTLEKA